ncbi:hypothetical protein GIS00_24880 [Nakamurella sp. YIM 132087]|uniref:Solute-binding protein family 5 domain-containing protein n=1 Tax=Nakamurella alba TaxID=2665158 RepID=A0A7K1FVE0_9ACTN|nr:ABC transporter substrate-binding protein [Nakamurella alba]MTD17173.1 hypothetical protein [Nakamurella alba]
MTIDHRRIRPRAGRRRGALVAAVTGAGMLLAACSNTPVSTGGTTPAGTTTAAAGSETAGSGTGSETAGGGGTPTGTITIVDTVFPPTFDPINTTNSSTNKVVRPLYDTLVAYTDGADAEMVPSVATEWTVSEDGLTYDFTLRDDVVFHSGNPLTAEDVKFTLDRTTEVGTGIAGGLAEYDSSTVVSPTELEVTLSKANHSFLGRMSRLYLLDSKLVQENIGDDNGATFLAANDAGSGPYTLGENVANQSTTFEAFPEYWKGWDGNHVQTVVFQYLSEAASQQAAVESGQADIGLGVPRESYAQFEQMDGFTVDASDSLEGLYVHFNNETGIMTDPKLRQAVAMAFDYETFAQNILLGYGTPAKGALNSMMPCQVDGLQVPTYDLADAKALVEEAGATGKTVDIVYINTLLDEVQGFELLQSALTEIGLQVNGMPMAYPAYAELLSSAETTPDMAFSYAYPLFPDPNEVLYINYDSNLIGKTNYARYSNPEVDKLVEEAQTVPLDQACEMYQQAQELIVADYPSVWISDNKAMAVIGPRVAGYAYNVAQHKSVDFYALSVKG